MQNSLYLLCFLQFGKLKSADRLARIGASRGTPAHPLIHGPGQRMCFIFNCVFFCRFLCLLCFFLIFLIRSVCFYTFSSFDSFYLFIFVCFYMLLCCCLLVLVSLLMF